MPSAPSRIPGGIRYPASRYGEADSCAHSRRRPLTHASTRALASESGLHAPLDLPWVWRAVAHASGRGTGVLPWLRRIAWLAGGQTQAVIQRTIEMRHHLGFSRWAGLSTVHRRHIRREHAARHIAMAQRAARVAPRAQGTLWEGSRRAASVWHPFARASSLQRRDPSGFPPRCSRPRESLHEASARAEAGARWSGDWGGVMERRAGYGGPAPTSPWVLGCRGRRSRCDRSGDALTARRPS